MPILIFIGLNSCVPTAVQHSSRGENLKSKHVMPRNSNFSSTNGACTLATILGYGVSLLKKKHLNTQTAPALTRPLDLPLPEGAKITAYPIVANYFFSYPQQSQNPQQSQQATQSYYPSQSQYPQQTEFKQPPRPLPYGESPQTQYYPSISHNLKDQSVSKSPGGADAESRQAGQPLYRHHQIVVVPWVQH